MQTHFKNMIEKITEFENSENIQKSGKIRKNPVRKPGKMFRVITEHIKE